MSAPPQGSQIAILENYPLKPLTTFKVGGVARYFAEIERPEDLPYALQFTREEGLDLFVLGGGSNILVSDEGFPGMVLHPVNRGVCIFKETPDHTLVRAAAGELWDDLVAWTTARNFWGIENLSHIPGQAGAALVQNVGAYGQQISDVLASVEVLDMANGRETTLTGSQCGFSYRASIFNKDRRERYLIWNLDLRLSNQPAPNLNYPDVEAHFERKDASSPSIQEIRQAIILIRDRKFPFPREEKGGNAGSFFKNLLLSEEDYQCLEDSVARNFSPREVQRLQELKSRVASVQKIKIPSAFLMEICGLRGCQIGQAKVNESQPLVLLNMGGATARDVLALAGHARRKIYQKTGVEVGIEPELVGFHETDVEEYLALA